MRRAVIVLVAVLLLPGAAQAGKQFESQAAGTYSIPRLGIRDMPWYDGATPSHLMQGPGRRRDIGSFGCDFCTVVLSGHRVTPVPGYGSHGPFRYVDQLQVGDVIRVWVKHLHRTFTYRMTHERVVSPNDVGVMDDMGYPQLVLTTCTPPHTATYRLIVFAKLVQ